MFYCIVHEIFKMSQIVILAVSIPENLPEILTIHYSKRRISLGGHCMKNDMMPDNTQLKRGRKVN